MHFSCLVITEHRPDEGAIDDIMWPWCLSNEERREAKVDYWEAAGGPFSNTFSIDDMPNEVAFSEAVIGPGNQRLKKDVPFDRLAAQSRPVLTYAVVKGGIWRDCGEMAFEGQMSAWEPEFAALLDTVDPECWLTVVDCHR